MIVYRLELRFTVFIWVASLVLLMQASCHATDTTAAYRIQRFPARQGVSLLLKLAESLDAKPDVRSKLLTSLPGLEHKSITLQSLAHVACAAGMDVDVRNISLSRLAMLRCPALVNLKGSDRFAVVMAIGTKYAIIWNNSGTDDYVDTANLVQNYAGAALVLRAVVASVISVSNPIISEISSGPMTYVSAIIPYRNICKKNISVVPQPCGCSQAPRGIVDKKVLRPGEWGHLTVKTLMPQFDPYCLPLPMKTSCKSVPVIYLGMMCFPPTHVVAYPSVIQVAANQFNRSSSSFSIYLPLRDRLLSIKFAHPANFLELHHFETKIDAPLSCPSGIISNIQLDLIDDAPLGSLRDDIVVTYYDSNKVHTFRCPYIITVRSSSSAEPSELFLGVVKPGTQYKRSITVRSQNSSSILITSAKGSTKEAQVTSFLSNDHKSISVVIDIPASSTGYFSGSFVLHLNDGGLLTIPYSGISSSD